MMVGFYIPKKAVMAALVAAIHDKGASAPIRFVDARNKSEHDDGVFLFYDTRTF
jgi:hypothetical protein